MKTSNRQKAIAFTAGFETGALHLLDYLHPTKYIEHEVAAPDGVEGMAGLLNILPEGSPKPNIVRAIEDGDTVFTHTEYNFFGRQAAIDIFRFEDGLIVEHWDNIQEFALPNPSGRTMIDGTTEVKDPDKTDENKALVSNFVNEVYVQGKVDKLAGYFDGDNYIQHSPSVADGLSGFKKQLGEWSAKGIKYDTIHKVLGEGNFVLVISEGQSNGKHTAFYDLFSVENGKIAEHWDIIMEIPPREAWKNDNGKF
ncbi:nuclear transport factor 2 family protein [Parapedobacter koreensis]|uniref:Predicted SnoaL-like aldol condensation-catalyzing enzyme n=1 Tax=Parapedobacter koreensis TaxID=332977 RepID=A0A1H7IUU5_9SPHI|nr:nuclear transport factor 2 family protein [Parapedobacter koreensis]SEK66176.1 Predicted SnoaL-like aldol condensation-catalyzing enzyme [Parapedobacter koreensis]